MASVPLSIIIPAYNESKRLPASLREIFAFMKDWRMPYEIIVVDDGSTDGTAEEARKIRENWKSLRLIINETNRGKGYSVRRGVLEAQFDYVLFIFGYLYHVAISVVICWSFRRYMGYCCVLDF